VNWAYDSLITFNLILQFYLAASYATTASLYFPSASLALANCCWILDEDMLGRICPILVQFFIFMYRWAA